MSRRSSKTQRWIDLLAALLSRAFPVSLEALKAEVPSYGASKSKVALRRMFERDKDELRSFGIPIDTVETDDGEQGYRLRARDFYLPYLTLRSDSAPKPRKVDAYGYKALAQLAFEPEELEAVVAGAARARQLGDPILAEHVESAMRKLACDLPVDAAAGDGTTVVPGEAIPADLLAALGRALEQRKRARFTYRSMYSDESTSRTVEPMGLFFLNGHWYLAARAGASQPVRNFRLSRIRDLEFNAGMPGTPDFEIPSEFDLKEHARARQAWELGEGESVEVAVRFRVDSGAARAARQLGEATDQPDVRSFRVRRPGPFNRWMLSFAGDLEPLSPPEMVQQYGQLVAATLRHHRGEIAGE